MKNIIRFFVVLLALLASISCSTSATKEELAELNKNDEFDQVIQVQSYEPRVEEKKEIERKIEEKKITKKKPVKKTVVKKKYPIKKEIEKIDDKEIEKEEPIHLPELEDSEGFIGRRPFIDPFTVGEESKMEVSFGFVSAGELILRTNPFVEVNGEKAYSFSVHVKSNSVFSLFYEVNDWAETFVRYKDLLPLSYALHVRESKQFKEARSFFDWEKLEMLFWEKKIRDGEKKEIKKKFPLVEYSQSILSAFFYLRTFTYKVGKDLEFRVMDDGKPLVIHLETIRKEKIEMDGQAKEAFVSKVRFEREGVFKQKGDILLWNLDDFSKKIIKIKANIKIGSLIIQDRKMK